MTRENARAHEVKPLLVPILWVGAMVALSGTTLIILAIVSLAATVTSAIRREWTTTAFLGFMTLAFAALFAFIMPSPF